MKFLTIFRSVFVLAIVFIFSSCEEEKIDPLTEETPLVQSEEDFEFSENAMIVTKEGEHMLLSDYESLQALTSSKRGAAKDVITFTKPIPTSKRKPLLARDAPRRAYDYLQKNMSNNNKPAALGNAGIMAIASNSTFLYVNPDNPDGIVASIGIGQNAYFRVRRTQRQASTFGNIGNRRREATQRIHGRPNQALTLTGRFTNFTRTEVEGWTRSSTNTFNVGTEFGVELETNAIFTSATFTSTISFGYSRANSFSRNESVSKSKTVNVEFRGGLRIPKGKKCDVTCFSQPRRTTDYYNVTTTVQGKVDVTYRVNNSSRFSWVEIPASVVYPVKTVAKMNVFSDEILYENVRGTCFNL